MTTRRSVLLAFGGLAAGAVVAGCRGGGKTTSTTTALAATEPSPTSVVPTTVAGPAVYPLTGLPLTDAAVAARPALSVKIDNAPKARPQSGLDKADVVFEEVVEGGVVRFMAVFHSADADPLGPIRSVRLVDASILTTLKGYFAYSGGADAFVQALQKTPATLVGAFELGEGTGVYRRRRDGGRTAPYNLYSSTGSIRAAAKPLDQPPPKLFSYRAAGSQLGGGAGPARNINVVMGERTTVAWAYADDSAAWARTNNGTPHVVEGGQQLRFPNIVLQFVPYRETSVRDTSGAVSPEAVIEGEGEAWVLSGPNLVKGRWRKGAAGEVTSYNDASGSPIGLQPGSTWVMLVPAGVVPQVS